MFFSVANLYSVLENLVDLLTMESSLQSSLLAQLKSLQTEMEKMEFFLKDAAEKREKDPNVREILMEIYAILDVADHMLDGLFFDYASNRSFCKRLLVSARECLGSSEANKVTLIKDQIRAFTKILQLHGIKKATTAMEGVKLNLKLKFSEQSHSCNNNFFVELKVEVEKLVSILIDEEQGQAYCPIIALHGMGGLGKTTLAKRLYNHPQVRIHFEGFAWAQVPQNFQTRKVLEGIFTQLVPEFEEEIMNFSVLELVQNLFEVQLSKKYLIVLDDVWDKDVWKCLNLAFPSNMTASKLVITTRSAQVAEQIADKGFAHSLRTLTTEESWELFLEKAFSGRSPSKFVWDELPHQHLDHNHQLNLEMNELATNVITKCNGLPLAIHLVGNLLEKKRNLNEWKRIYQLIDKHSSTEFGSQEFSQVPRVLAWSYYDNLPHYLKPCFLYTGIFPEGFKIEKEKLCQLWIAEGLIPSTTDKSCSKIVIAECFLDELVSRNMLQLQEESSPTSRRRIKTIHLHELMRHVSLLKGKDDGFTEVTNLGNANQINTCYPTACRLAVHTDNKEDREFITFRNYKTRPLHSLLLFNVNQNQKHTTLPPVSSCFLEQVRSLRTLHIDAFNLGTGKLPKGIWEITSLTYLSFSQCFLDELPSSIVKLRNLRTLDLQSSSRIYIPNVLWKIERLRHLYLPVQFRVHRDEKLRLDSLINLMTLQNFDASLCKAKDLSKLTKLCLLGFTMKRNLDYQKVTSNCSSTLSKSLHQSSLIGKGLGSCPQREHSILRNLFKSPTLNNLHVEGHIGNLPQLISSSLTELLLSGAQLDDDPMTTLEKLPRLLILDLDNDAFRGKQMVCSASGFPSLELLRLSNLHNLEKLTIEKGGMPNLSTLVIEKCRRLDVHPGGFNHLQSLQSLKITKCFSNPGLEECKKIM